MNAHPSSLSDREHEDAARVEPVTDSRCHYVTSGPDRICNKCGRRHDGGRNPNVPFAATTTETEAK